MVTWPFFGGFRPLTGRSLNRSSWFFLHNIRITYIQILIYYVGIPKCYEKVSKDSKNRNLSFLACWMFQKPYSIMTSVKLSKLLLDLTNRSLDEFSQFFFAIGRKKADASFSKSYWYTKKWRKLVKNSKNRNFGQVMWPFFWRFSVFYGS